VLAGIEYRQAAPLDDCHDALLAHVAANPVTPVFSCNCILNYLYAGLAGARPLSITGPATFGEIAYGLLARMPPVLVSLSFRYKHQSSLTASLPPSWPGQAGQARP
jgi:hypothetical protein